MTRQQFIEEVAAVQESLRRFLRGLCGGDGFRADDIAQEALLKAYMSFGRFEGRSRFSTWLFRIAYNCYHDNLGKKDMGEGGDLAAGEARLIVDRTSEADRNFEYQQLYMAIGKLGKEEQAVVLLFYMEDRSVRDIVEITGMPSGTVRSHLSRARKHLKEFLKNRI